MGDVCLPRLSLGGDFSRLEGERLVLEAPVTSVTPDFDVVDSGSEDTRTVAGLSGSEEHQLQVRALEYHQS